MSLKNLFPVRKTAFPPSKLWSGPLERARSSRAVQPFQRDNLGLGFGSFPLWLCRRAITAPICGWPLRDTENGKLARPQGFITSDVPYTTRWLTTAKLLRQLSTTSKDNLCLSSIHRTVKDELRVACPSSPFVS